MPSDTPLRVLALVCSLKPSPAPSSSSLLAEQVLRELKRHDIEGAVVRVVDHNLAPGVEKDMGGEDQWPDIRAQLLEADILLIATPIWLGHMSSVAQRVLERIDAELAETDHHGRPSMWDKVAIAAIVGNEDGAHKVTADLFQALSDTGFTIPAQGATYWVGEAMSPTDYNDLPETPDAVSSAIKDLASCAAHLAKTLRHNPYPADRS
ncbi:flavodoxin family protein [Antrihabitans stalactiti]|uniref:Flavodoxin family protein n=1 Tax=Antrihabitans stalactiti TaxID=2584121 RepID=A0A848KKG2_9NOCA|nr:NAD(P)H-dependent oxidoreductase [Antrihabitans stalactiti]NMN99175.1 flavodoxin family protein [Antrihabitans stalactiti]